MLRASFFLKSVSSKILAALAGVSLVSISVAVILVSIQSGRVLRSSITERNLQIARQLSSEIARYIGDSESELASFGKILGPLPYEPWIRSTVLANLTLEFKRFRWIGLLGEDGVVIADSRLDGTGSIPLDRESVAAVMAGSTFTSPVRISEDDTPYSVLSAPTRIGNGRRGWLVAELHLRNLWSLVDAIVVGGEGVAYIVSSSGRLIAHPDKRRVLSPDPAGTLSLPPSDTGDRGIVREEKVGGVDRYLTAYAKVSGTEWVVAVQQPIKDAFLPASILLRQSLFLVLFGLGLSLALGVLFSRMITAPLAHLLEGIRAIRTGGLDYRIRIRAGDEIGRLANSYNEMVESLQARTSELEESELRYRLLTERVNDVIFSLDEQGRFSFCNPRIEAITGYKPAELIRVPFVELVSESDAETARATIRELAESRGRMEREMKTEISGRDGRKAMLEVRLTADEGLDGARQLYGVARDVSERERLMGQLSQAQKMEAVGRLAGGIAHDFNNLLTAILGYCDYASGRLDDADSLGKSLEEIRRAGKRAASLTHQLLAFSRKQVMQPKVIDLNPLIANLEKLLRRLIGEDIALVTRLAPDLEAIYADPGQIEQVIMNLCINARDAMPRGGDIVLETANVSLDGSRFDGKVAVVAGSYVLLRVADTGIGMDEATKSRLFEPFFTTKEPGKGTGLGLSTVYGIVKQTGGYIGADSQPGKGATFEIYFPRTNRDAQSIAAPDRPPSVSKGRESILLVEDEQVVRQLGKTVLKDQGYTVIEAADGESAEEIFRSHRDEIQLIVTDVVLPRMNGRELVERLRALKPGVHVLYMSGYTSDAIVHHGVLDEGISFIQKPFAMQALLAKVREVLDKPASG